MTTAARFLAMFKTFSVSMSLKFDSISKKTFYRAMHVGLVLARYCYRKSSVRLSVRLSVCDVDVPWAYRLVSSLLGATTSAI